jgi:hypothetical protein
MVFEVLTHSPADELGARHVLAFTKVGKSPNLIFRQIYDGSHDA